MSVKCCLWPVAVVGWYYFHLCYDHSHLHYFVLHVIYPFIDYIIIFFLFLGTGLPPLVFRRILEIMAYLATNHSAVANMLFNFDTSIVLESSSSKYSETKAKGKEKIMDGAASTEPLGNLEGGDVPLVLFLKLLNRPLFLRSTAHLEQVK